MKKIISLSITALLLIGLATGCESNKKENKKVVTDDTQTKVDIETYEGLEFVNIKASEGVIKTIVINNTGVVCEDLNISIKVMDKDGNTIVGLTDKVKGKIETGTTKTIETKVDKDLSKAASIEYSIVK